MEKNPKQLNSNNLAAFWILVLAGFMGLQFNIGFQSINKSEKKETTSVSFLISTAQHSAASGLSPDLKFLQTWFQHAPQAFEFLNNSQSRPGFVFHILLKENLIRLLQASISINAP
jgi:hypothetical protein